MDALENLLVMQITMLILFLAGFLLVKRGVITPAFRKALTDFILAFILPCNILKSFLIEFNSQILRQCISIFLISCGAQALSIVLGHLLFGRAREEKRPSLIYATQISNAGFWEILLWRVCTAARGFCTLQCI